MPAAGHQRKQQQQQELSKESHGHADVSKLLLIKSNRCSCNTSVELLEKHNIDRVCQQTGSSTVPCSILQNTLLKLPVA
jgi:hypothetical protein